MPAPESLSRTLPGLPSAVPEARALAREFLGGSPRSEDAELIVSELATNAVLHAHGEFALALELAPGSLRIEVTDRGAPVRSQPRIEPGEGGRGLVIVDALADDWGHEQHTDRARWWAELWTEES